MTSHELAHALLALPDFDVLCTCEELGLVLRIDDAEPPCIGDETVWIDLSVGATDG